MLVEYDDRYIHYIWMDHVDDNYDPKVDENGGMIFHHNILDIFDGVV
jgi:hypothetical protein